MQEFKRCLLLALAVWFIPFALLFTQKPAIPFGEGKTATTRSSLLTNNQDTLNKLIVRKDLKRVFTVILKNNIEVGLLNISGAAFIGLSTIINLALNGLNLATAMNDALEQGVPLAFLIRSLLAPHIIELLGIWITGAAGLLGAKICINYIFYGVLPQKKQFKTILYSGFIGLAIITIAAWLEVYITIKNYL